MGTATRWKEREFRIRFLTPAFLGDAEQKGRWRTPSFKALLRQWWRVAYAARHNYRVSIADMREAEGKLFGNAWLTTVEDGKQKADFSRSKVRLRLEPWNLGGLERWQNLEPSGVVHPEVDRASIGPHLYLGYGPLEFSRGTSLKRAPAINAGETATLRLAFPAEQESLLLQALGLMHLYGTVGGRSRNGWGSFVLEPPPNSSAPIPTRNWEAALGQSWPHAIGQKGEHPLIWQTTKTYQGWSELIRALAIIRIAVRTQFAFRGTEPHKQPEPRHWLSYPVTKHTCEPWGKQLRLPNTLRFKVRRVSGNDNQLVGVIYHMPCLPPDEFGPQPYREEIQKTWRQVHWLLDELGKPAGQRKFEGRINESKWLQKVSPQLSGITLQRIEE